MTPDHPSRPPLIVGITTLPSRIRAIRPTLESLLSGDLKPDSIRIVCPAVSLREKTGYAIPDFLADPRFHGGVVELVRVERDFGPGSKLLGVLPSLEGPSYLVIADDDVRYRPDFLAGLYEAQAADHGSSFSYFTYTAERFTLGQGCDGFSFWAPNLQGITDFFLKYVDGTDVMFHDDLWISLFLASRGIAVRSLAHKLGSGLIYE